jgi:hypothetical protein
MQRQALSQNNDTTQNDKNKLNSMQFGDLAEVHEVDVNQEEEKSQETYD